MQASGKSVITQNLGTDFEQSHVKPALEDAFRRVDGEVSALRLEAFQHTKLTVWVHDGWIYTGSSARVLLSRSFKPVYLHSWDKRNIMIRRSIVPESEEEILDYFHMKHVQEDDAFVAISSDHIWI
ncbi:hypothetical protein SELMODRAFT_429136 [Selaginella moellendorffii]|uniref:Uncharacterized protein n=1 Tax=Selaginella moellendorffii TaxID=88036 RepID=D8T563_SELML|nr:hypothetical protein SELMODRAFT_429136 [Selaginella moellendorffii]